MIACARLLILLGCAAMLLGCSHLLTGRPGDRNVIGGAYRVDPQIEWSRLQGRKLQIWTVDGPLLEQLRLYAGIEDGDTLFPTAPAPGQERQYRPAYRAGMHAHDVMELVTITLMQSGAVDVVTTRLRPADFGGRSGFRFDLHYKSEIGLGYRGLAAGLITGDKHLQLILYTAAQPHYFGAYEAVVERIMDSVSLL